MAFCQSFVVSVITFESLFCVVRQSRDMEAMQLLRLTCTGSVESASIESFAS